MPKILVTGGNGFIGSHTSVELLKRGYEVVIIDNLCNSKPYVQNRIKEITGVAPTFYECDLLDFKTLKLILKEHSDISGIIHFAAHLFVEESVTNPIKYYKNNIDGLLNLIESASELSQFNLVFSSSCTVYGNPSILPIAENESTKPAQSPYGNTKKICEEILFDYTKSADKKNVISLRYFNPVGAHPSGLIGEDPIGHHTHLVPIISEVAKRKRAQLKIFGNDYATKDGTCVRDYLSVNDLAKAHVLAVESLLNGNTDSFRVYNVGSGTGYTVKEIADSFEKVSGINIPREMVERRPGDVEAVYADISKISNDLGWRPQESLNDMLLANWNWERSIENNER